MGAATSSCGGALGTGPFHSPASCSNIRIIPVSSRSINPTIFISAPHFTPGLPCSCTRGCSLGCTSGLNRGGALQGINLVHTVVTPFCCVRNSSAKKAGADFYYSLLRGDESGPGDSALQLVWGQRFRHRLVVGCLLFTSPHSPSLIRIKKNSY